MHRSILTIFIFCFVLTSIASNHTDALAADRAVEISITLSGTILLGIGCRFNIDDDSSIRLGSYISYGGILYGFHTGFVQTFLPEKNWSPYVGLGGDAMLAREQNRYKMVYFLKGVTGFAYFPNNVSAWDSELWVAFFPMRLRVAPIGLSFGYLNTLK